VVNTSTGQSQQVSNNLVPLIKHLNQQAGYQQWKVVDPKTVG
jgi:hypothetical protein